MILWLVGMMGSGKSTAGRLASRSLGVPYHDTDAFVVERTGCSVAQLWGEKGEVAFRDMEKAAVRTLATRKGIVSTGGGVVLDADNRNTLRGSRVVWLEASPETLARRLDDVADRPGLVKSGHDPVEFLEEMLDARTPLYEAVASHRIDTTALTPGEVAGAIEGIWNA